MEETNNTTANGEDQNNRWAWIVTGVVIVVVVAGFYMWPQESSSPANTSEENQVVQQEEVDATAAALRQVSPSDEINDIENDLNSTNLLDLDKEVTDIEAEVNSEQSIESIEVELPSINIKHPMSAWALDVFLIGVGLQSESNVYPGGKNPAGAFLSSA